MVKYCDQYKSLKQDGVHACVHAHSHTRTHTLVHMHTHFSATVCTTDEPQNKCMDGTFQATD